MAREGIHRGSVEIAEGTMNEWRLRGLIAKWRNYAASTYSYGSCAETRAIEAAWRNRAKEDANELEAVLAAPEPREKESSILDSPETWRGIGHELDSTTVAAGPVPAPSGSQTRAVESFDAQSFVEGFWENASDYIREIDLVRAAYAAGRRSTLGPTQRRPDIAPDITAGQAASKGQLRIFREDVDKDDWNEAAPPLAQLTEEQVKQAHGDLDYLASVDWPVVTESLNAMIRVGIPPLYIDPQVLDSGAQRRCYHTDSNTGQPAKRLTGEQLKTIALKHRTTVAGYEFCDKFDFDAIAAELSEGGLGGKSLS